MVEEEKKTTENVVNSTNNSSEEKVVEKTKSSVLRIITLSVLGLVVIFGIMLIPFKSRTTLGRIFDVLGAHKLAMKTDAVINRDKGVGNVFAIIDVKKEKSFEKSWNKIKKADLKLEAVSMKDNFSIYPANEQNKDSFKINGKVNYNVSLKDQKASGDLKFSFSGDGEKIKDLEQFGKISADISLKGVIDNERVYYKIESLNLNSGADGLKINVSLDDWYHSPSFELSDEKKNALNEIAKLVTELTETKPYQVISDETGRKFSKLGYGMYDNINVGGVKKVSFGSDENKVEKKVREINVKFDLKKFEEMNKEDLADKYFDAIESAVNDSTLQNYMKNDFYEWANKLKPQVENLVEEKSDEEWTKDKWNKDFDEKVAEFNKDKEKSRKDFKEGFMGGMATDSDVKMSDMVEILEYNVYLEPGTNDYYAIKEKIKIKPLTEDLDEMKENSPEVYELFKDGIIMEFEAYDINFNEKVQPVEIPTNSKSEDEFMKTFQKNKGLQDFSDFVDGVMSSFYSSKMPSESVIFQDPQSGMYIYYEASTGMYYQIIEVDQNTGNVYYMDANGQKGIVPIDVVKRSFEGVEEQQSNQKTNMTDEEQKELEKME